MVPLDARLAWPLKLTHPVTVRRQEFHGSAEELHALPMPTAGETTEVWQLRPNAPALVMGSAQRPGDFDRSRLERDAVDLAPRRSGGGAVFIAPSSVLWVDVLAPRSSDLWSTDLGETFVRTGAIWQQALRTCGIETELFMSAPAKSDVARLACWAGLGWGELTIEGSKVLGLSQRRTRWGARIQAMLVLDSSSQRVADYLPAEHQASVRAHIGTTHLAAVQTANSSLAEVEAAVLDGFRVAFRR